MSCLNPRSGRSNSHQPPEGHWCFQLWACHGWWNQGCSAARWWCDPHCQTFHGRCRTLQGDHATHRRASCFFSQEFRPTKWYLAPASDQWQCQTKHPRKSSWVCPATCSVCGSCCLLDKLGRWKLAKVASTSQLPILDSPCVWRSQPGPSSCMGCAAPRTTHRSHFAGRWWSRLSFWWRVWSHRIGWPWCHRWLNQCALKKNILIMFCRGSGRVGVYYSISMSFWMLFHMAWKVVLLRTFIQGVIILYNYTTAANYHFLCGILLLPGAKRTMALRRVLKPSRKNLTRIVSMQAMLTRLRYLDILSLNHAKPNFLF